MTGTPLRVVIADDQRVVRDGLVTILGAIDGVQVIGAARNGAEAVALAGEQDADAVLMDLRMPGMDGVEATRAVRASRPATAVVVLTTYTDDESILAALQAGAAGSAPGLPDGLTEREGEVLALIAQGLSNAEIASQLFVSRSTVKTHINQIFAKTSSRDRPQAIVYAQKHGLR